MCVCESVCVKERERVEFPPQHSVGSAFTVAEQSGRHSRPAGSTWHAISSAPGTLAAQPAQPKHTRPGDQNNAKQTHAKHTDYTQEGGRDRGRREGSTSPAQQSSSRLVCLEPPPLLPSRPGGASNCSTAQPLTAIVSPEDAMLICQVEKLNEHLKEL